MARFDDNDAWDRRQADRDEFLADQQYEKEQLQHDRGDCDEDTCRFCKRERRDTDQ